MINIKKLNGSFVININNMPYNTTEGDVYFDKTLELYKSNPELFEIEEEQEVIKYGTKEYIEELKQQKIREIKLKANMIIEDNNNYPIFKQINIQRDYLINPEDQTIKEKFEIMNEFIDNIRNYSNELEEKISTLTVSEEIENFPIDYSEITNKTQ